MAKIFTKWGESRGDKPGLKEDEFKKVMPLLAIAAAQSNEELQVRWAALLEHVATSTDGVLPSFGQTLSQLTVEEAKFLDRLFAFVSEATPYMPPRGPGRRTLERVQLIQIYDPAIDPGINPAEFELYKDNLTNEQLHNYERLRQAELVIQDMERLGILTQQQIAEPERFHRLGEDKIPVTRSQTLLRSIYSLSPYGRMA